MAAALRSSMLAKQRLTKEYRQILSEPIDNCIIRVDTKDLFTWYYCIDGASGTELEGGKYFGRVLFPPEYPMKPPTVHMDTPNGLLKRGESICMSMTAWHPESWSPSWGPRTIVLGLIIFFEAMVNGQESSATMEYPRGDVKALAAQSKHNNSINPAFIAIFPDLIEAWKSGSDAPSPETKKSADAPASPSATDVAQAVAQTDPAAQ